MPVICVSGQSTCGTSTTAKLLAEKLGLKYFSPGQYFKKHAAGLETESAINVWNTEKGSSKSFHEEIDRLQQKTSEEGNVVIDGKLSIRMIKNADLKVWLKAGEKIRIGRVMKRDGISEEEAEKKLKDKDGLERVNWKKIYGFDSWEQEKEADLVIDASDKRPEEIVEIIIKRLNIIF